jgi:hypothetical protein
MLVGLLWPMVLSNGLDPSYGSDGYHGSLTIWLGFSSVPKRGSVADALLLFRRWQRIWILSSCGEIGLQLIKCLFFSLFSVRIIYVFANTSTNVYAYGCTPSVFFTMHSWISQSQIR